MKILKRKILSFSQIFQFFFQIFQFSFKFSDFFSKFFEFPFSQLTYDLRYAHLLVSILALVLVRWLRPSVIFHTLVLVFSSPQNVIPTGTVLSVLALEYFETRLEPRAVLNRLFVRFLRDVGEADSYPKNEKKIKLRYPAQEIIFLPGFTSIS